MSQEFNEMWQFLHCFGALDGRHIEFRAPISTGSFYYNYKGTKSIVLLGLVDAKYKFLYVNVGVNGHVSDGVYIIKVDLHARSRHKRFTFPCNCLTRPTGGITLLSEHLMKPYPSRDMDHDEKFSITVSQGCDALSKTPLGF